jgi:hypothetical protein
MTYSSSLKGKLLNLIKKIILALGIAFLFTFLGLYGGIGYQVNSINEIYFYPHNNLGYADACFYCDIYLNPIIYPSYWLKGIGHIAGNFTIMYLPESYYPGEFGGPIWGLSERGRYEYYIMYIITGATYSDLLIIFLIGIGIEAIEKRSLYLVLFAGIIGFAAGGISGTLIGLGLGVTTALIIMFVLSKDNILSRVWYSLWE